ncbi:methylglyoxal reductase [Propionivibrio dicarboxylicus]|uniref:Methylglyoxal reductase n=2 Tax=Propionivibrio dicarboxylicus TaxID=83767 RepID=A0A1G8FGN4_9RHOO|nr:methylglyoxal reductase [Propionivibrio dicarboxylicus]
MRSMKIGKSGIEASVVGIGAWAIGGDSMWGASDDAESVRTIHRARDLGVTLLDTAPAYGLGHSEEVVGKALTGRRGDYVLSTKCGLRWDIGEGAFMMERDGVRIVRNSRPESLAQEVEASLRRLKTDYIDIYIVHWQELPEFPCPIADTMGYLGELKRQGKIRAIGASNLSDAQFMEYVAAGQLDLIQEKFSMLDRGVGDRLMGLCGTHGVTFQAYSPLERGILTGKITAATQVEMGLARSRIKWFQPENLSKIAALSERWAPLCKKYGCSMTQLVIGWTAAQGNGSNVSVLCGARKLHQIEDNAKGGDIVLDAADIATMRADVEAIA